MIHRFVPTQKVVATFDGLAPYEGLLAERGMFAADEDFARTHCGPIAARVLDAIPSEYRDDATARGLSLNIDVRVHDLRVGQCPAAPGWHCDAAQREVAFDPGARTEAVARSLLGTVSSSPDGVSNTVFVNDPVTVVSDAAPGSAALWRDATDALRVRFDFAMWDMPDGSLTEFDDRALHTATAAHADGARLLVRVSMWSPPPGHRPGLSRSEQVYTLDPDPFLRLN